MQLNVYLFFYQSTIEQGLFILRIVEVQKCSMMQPREAAAAYRRDQQ